MDVFGRELHERLAIGPAGALQQPLGLVGDDVVEEVSRRARVAEVAVARRVQALHDALQVLARLRRQRRAGMIVLR